MSEEDEMDVMIVDPKVEYPGERGVLKTPMLQPLRLKKLIFEFTEYVSQHADLYQFPWVEQVVFEDFVPSTVAGDTIAQPERILVTVDATRLVPNTPCRAEELMLEVLKRGYEG